MPQVTVSLPGATTTTTVHQTSVALATQVYTIGTATTTPVVTQTAANRTVYTTTSYTSTTSTKNIHTHTVTSVVTGVKTATSTATSTTTAYGNTVFFQPAAATVTTTVTKTPTIISTCTRGATRTTTSTHYASACTPSSAGVTTIIPKRSGFLAARAYTPSAVSEPHLSALSILTETHVHDRHPLGQPPSRSRRSLALSWTQLMFLRLLYLPLRLSLTLPTPSRAQHPPLRRPPSPIPSARRCWLSRRSTPRLRLSSPPPTSPRPLQEPPRQRSPPPRSR